MKMRAVHYIPLLAVLIGCLSVGCSKANSSPVKERAVQKQGLWETTTTAVSMDRSDWSRAETDAFLKRFDKPVINRYCFDGYQPLVGETFVEGQCRWTRISDVGEKIDRIASCTIATADGKQMSGDMSFVGQRAPSNYVMQIVDESRSPSSGALSKITTREEGRWVGPC